ncbi:MAG: efflux RND transporter permease subunit [Rhodospirillales bacterium]
MSEIAGDPTARTDASGGRPGFTDLFIRRPVLATVVSLLILLLGGMAYLNLQIRQFPELTNTTITINTGYAGANAELMRGYITAPLEQAVAGVAGIDYMTSSSTQGSSSITLTLRLDSDGNAALTEVLAKVNQTGNLLPREADAPIVEKQTGQGLALLYLGFSSESMSATQITDYLDRVVQPKLQAVSGVGEAQIIGGQPFAMRIWLDPRRMAALGITAGDVERALLANNVAAAPGQVKGDYTLTGIDAATDLDSPEAFAQLVVAVREGNLIRLGSIAEIALGPENLQSSSVYNGTPAIFMAIFPTPEANPLSVIERVHAVLPAIEAQLPQGLDSGVGYDATLFIQASIDEVLRTLIEATIIVVAVILLFLGSLRSTLVPIVTIPLSLIGVMIALLALGYSLNLMTFLAMVLAIGLVVDDAIVVVENIHRHIEEGLSPYRAALVGAREIKTPVITMTVTLAAVYAPIGFVGGLTGTLFREFAFTLAGAVIVSGVIALTLSPMMCAKLLPAESSSSRFAGLLDRGFARLKQAYERSLQAVLGARPAVLLVVAALTGGCAFLYLSTPSELAPAEDQGIVLTQTQAPRSANLDYLEAYTSRLDPLFKSFPEYADYFLINGAGSVNLAEAGLVLKPWQERGRSQAEIEAEVQAGLNRLAGVEAYAYGLPPLPVSGSGPAVQFVITTLSDYRTLYEVLQRFEAAASASGVFSFVDSDLTFDKPQIDISIDRSKANELGITMADIAGTLSTLVGEGYVNRFNLYGRSYTVVPQVPRGDRLTQAQLGRYHVRTRSGDMVPLASLVTLERSVRPNALTTFQQLNAATLVAGLAPGRSMGEALALLEETADQLLPEGFFFALQGESRQFAEEGANLAITFGFAVIVIFLVLAAQYESFRDPLIILIAVPLSVFGALLPLFFGLATINIFTQIGLVTLIGLISKHGILMVDFANHLQAEGLDRRAAIQQAAAARLRPILMTTAAMVVAMIPLLLADGAGAASRFGIGLVIAAGMTVGTLFTLFVVPTLYSYIARDRSSLG